MVQMMVFPLGYEGLVMGYDCLQWSANVSIKVQVHIHFSPTSVLIKR